MIDRAGAATNREMKRVLPWVAAVVGFLIGTILTYLLLDEVLHLKGSGVIKLAAVCSLAMGAGAHTLASKLLGVPARSS